MSFEKEFPGLVAYDREVCPAYTENDLSRVCTVSQIQERCLSKKRVKKAIISLAEHEIKYEFFEAEEYVFAEKLLKKLGLIKDMKELRL